MNAPAQKQPAELLSVENFPEPRFKLTAWDNISFSDQRDYLVKGILPLRGLALAYGAKKCGKSFWALDISAHIAAGWEYRGRRVQQRAVVYVAAEGGFGFGRRVGGFRQRYEGKGFEFYLITTRPSLVRDHKQLVAEIQKQLPNIEPGLVVLDTLNRTLEGSEGKDEDMAAFIQAAGMIEDTFKCCVLVVHHSGLEAGRPRGHTSLSAAADVQIAVTRDGAENVVATVELAKDSEAGATIVSRLESVEIGIDPDGDPITTCVVVPTDTSQQGATEPSLTKNQQTMFAVLHSAGRPISTEEWNTRAREAGLGLTRKADLYDLRSALASKHRVTETGMGWIIKL